MILDGGPCALGLESTVLGIDGDDVTLLRLGALPRENIEKVLGRKLTKRKVGSHVTSPGQLATHYAPLTPLRLNARSARRGEALLSFGAHAPEFAGPTINLSQRGDLVEAAANFFAALRALDEAGVETIAVMPIPAHGLGEAINDRLKRASSPATIPVSVELP